MLAAGRCDSDVKILRYLKVAVESIGNCLQDCHS